MAGGARFSSPGLGTGFGNSLTGTVDNAFGNPTQALSRLLATLTGTDVDQLAKDTANTMKTMQAGPGLP